jgi:hypothetical protein
MNEVILDRTRFFRRRQFILGPEQVDYPGWRKFEIDNQHLLTVHPDLPTTIVQHKTNKLVLLGYAIDPYDSERTELDILQRAVVDITSEADVISSIENLSGRFVLVVKHRNHLWLFHDAVALRQVNYCLDKRGAIWCASQPEALAAQLKLKYDEEVLSFKNSSVWSTSKDEFWLPNKRTPFQEIRNLLPNHYLDLQNAQAIRYWPVAGCIGSRLVSESIELCTPILKGSIRAAALKFDLRMGISAGGDSRKTLAASKCVKEQIYYFSHTPTQASMLVNDVEIPARLLPKLGVKHHSLLTERMPWDFQQLYEENVSCAREKRGHIAYTLLQNFGPEATVLNSNISEVAQCIYWLPKAKINGEGLAILSGLNHQFAIQEFQEWIDGAASACNAANMNILDLFFLEQRMGRWAASAFSEYDIAHETFNPYNNRRLHCLMLAIDERHRKNRRWDVTIEHIRHMWPEVLLEPINPPDRVRDRMQQHIRRKRLPRIFHFMNTCDTAS